jgi:hypothetical protein
MSSSLDTQISEARKRAEDFSLSLKNARREVCRVTVQSALHEASIILYQINILLSICCALHCFLGNGINENN